MSEWDDDAGLPAVVSHRMLNSIAVVIGVTETLCLNEDALGRERRLELLGLMGREAAKMSLVLQDLVRGLPIGTTTQPFGSRGVGSAWLTPSDNAPIA